MKGLYLKDNALTIGYSSEADIQGGVAEMAKLHGWRVQTELVIPGWGRLDLVLHNSQNYDDFAVVVEFKAELTKAAVIRKAFQQADGYYRWLVSNHGESVKVILSAPKIDWALANDVAYVYRDSVKLSEVGEVMHLVSHSAFDGRRESRAREVHDELVRQSRMANYVFNQMASTRKSRKSAHYEQITRMKERTAEKLLSP